MARPSRNPSLKILIVDDQTEVQKLLEIVLHKEGREFFRAGSGHEAISVAKRERPQIIFLDIMMPGDIDGLDVTRILKNDPHTAGSFIITMTARVQKNNRTLALQAGADDCVAKPFDFSEIEEKVENVHQRLGSG